MTKGRKVTDEKKTIPLKSIDTKKQIPFIEVVAGIGSLYRTAGINHSLVNVAVLLKLNDLYATKGIDASIKDIQMVVNTVVNDPAFKEQKQQ